mmetsp:Transcript_70841/g.169621  ORF Transcript_70841/g.169621 Transcript_70841/m.169621 type:complete len:262 (+) Transcript_70841:449-1234(+)
MSLWYITVSCSRFMSSWDTLCLSGLSTSLPLPGELAFCMRAWRCWLLCCRASISDFIAWFSCCTFPIWSAISFLSYSTFSRSLFASESFAMISWLSSGPCLICDCNSSTARCSSDMRSAFSFSASRLSCSSSMRSSISSPAPTPPCLRGSARASPADEAVRSMWSGIGMLFFRRSCSYIEMRAFASISACSFFSRKNLSSATDLSMLTLTTFLIIFARCPKRKVLMVSCSLKVDGETVMISDVFELPPKDSDSILVNLESR